MDAIQTLQRELFGWSIAQYTFAVEDKKKTLLEDVLNALHLTSEFTTDLNSKLERKELWDKTTDKNTTKEYKTCGNDSNRDVVSPKNVFSPVLNIGNS